MNPMSIRFILKSGKEFTVKCSDFTFEYNRVTNTLVAYDLKGIIENGPVFLDLSEVAAVIRLVQDEQEGGSADG